MKDQILLKNCPKPRVREIALPASKSESNRMLIIQAISDEKINIQNLSDARDTQTMLRLLTSSDAVLDVIDAGTTMRFLTAYLAATNQPKQLTGSERMQQRPLKILVDALREIGAEIQYLDKDGYPPIQIKGIASQKKDRILVRGDISSQYISALLMIAATLPDGLEIELTGKIGSRPYIEMTLGLMSRFGVKNEWNGNTIRIANQKYAGGNISIESDWSAASYWYSIVALASSAEFTLKGLRPNSLQADIRIVMIMDKLGVGTEFNLTGVRIFKKPQSAFNHIDFSDCPDLAQTVAVTCAALGKKCTFTGLESLRIKETDRIAALQNELHKIGASLSESNNEWTLIPSENLPAEVEIETYEDHRMAMAFAPLGTLMNVKFKEPNVVVKSYPSFWDDLKLAGFEIE